MGKAGIETFESPQLPAPATKPDPVAEFMGTYDNKLLREQEASILADLKQRNLTDPGDAQKALVRSLAGTQIQLLFERLQTLIWASQVVTLTYLNSRPAPVPPSEVRPFYDDAAQQFAPLYAAYTFEDWLRFLESWGLVHRDDKGIVLTGVGREFLKWRIEVGRAGPFHG